MPVIRSQETTAEGAILIEVDTLPADVDPVYGETREDRAGKLLKSADGLFQEGLDLARRCAGDVASTFKQAADGVRPQEVEVGLAIKLDAEVGAILAKTSAGAQLDVKLKWTLDA